ncbi:HAMP domain-containing protein [Desulfuromonas versatilis]|nr:HAMP domain-containing protein [Desulfuromonas versatilis]
MRLTLKHQIILAPATVLLLMTLLLGFLQYTYWDLSIKRQQARNLGTAFVALAEIDLTTQRLYRLAIMLSGESRIELGQLQAMAELHANLGAAVERVMELMPLPDRTVALLQQSVNDLNPERGFDAERILSAISILRPQLLTLSELTQKQRARLRDIQARDIDELVARTTLVSIVVLGAAILLGIFLSLALGRNILRRIQALSDSAGRIVRGDLSPPPAPARVRDELDELAVSINRMTDQLIRVVGSEKLLEGAEEERRRIAMDIHDQTLSDLSSVLRGIQELKQASDCRPQASRLEEDLQKAMTNLREVMDNLHPQALEILGLGAALQSHLERHLSRGDLPEYHLYVSPEVDAAGLSRLARLTLYRIAVEAIHNVIKHARASRYEVDIDRRAGALVLAVEDNGVGFDPKNGALGRGRGLHNIQERANAIGARVAWKPSRFTSGTRFELILPLRESSTQES